MRVIKVKNQTRRIIVFVICVIFGFNTTVGFGEYKSSPNKHFVQVGIDKVWAGSEILLRSTSTVNYPDYYAHQYYTVTSNVLYGNISYGEFDYMDTTAFYVWPIENPTLYSSFRVQQWEDSQTIYCNLYGTLQNTLPTISVTSPSPNGTFSEVTGYSTISLQGSVSDTNIGDVITTKYNIDGGTTQTVSGTVTTSGSFTTTNISVGSLSEGSHTLSAWCVDNQGASSATTAIPFKVDKTAPTLGTVIVTSTTNGITISGSATDAIAGLDAYPYRYTVSTKTPTSWLTAASYTQSSLAANTQYTATFEARDAKGHIASKAQSIYTKAEVPAITVNNPTSYTLDVSMSDNNPSATQYQVITGGGTKYVTPEGTLTTSPVWITPTGKKITVKGLSASTAYTFQVKAKNGDGVETALSSAVSGTTLIAPPAAPANLIATATDKTITVAWDAAATATSYEIEADGTVISTGTSTRYIHTGLNPGTPHNYRVRGKNAGGAGSWSIQITKSTLPSAPGVPANLSAVPLSTMVTVTWDNVGGATGYDIEVDGVLVSNGPNTNYRHTNLTPGTSHTYKVRSVNAGDKSDWSAPITVKTLLDSTPIPVNVNAERERNRIVISWDPVDGATGYEIEVDGVRIDNNTRTTYTHNNLQAGSEHTYRVRSKKTGVISDWSAMLVVTTLTDQFGTPENFKAEAQDTSVTLTWAPVTDATGYDIEIDGEISDIGGITSCVHNGLEPKSTHSYRVRARGENGLLSDWSGELTIDTFVLPSPQGFEVTATETTLETVWEAVYGAAGYSLEFDGAVITDINDTSYTVDGLKPGTQHTMRVMAVNGSDTSNWSIAVTKSTALNVFDTPVASGLTTKNMIMIKWNNVNDAIGYEIEIDGSMAIEVPGTSYTHSWLLPGEQHTYRIRAKYENRDPGEWSKMLTATTLSQNPAIPTNVKVSSSMTSILVTWDRVEGAEKYELEVDGVTVDVGAGTSYLHAGLTPDTPHTYRVTAWNAGGGYSGWSEAVTKNTLSSVQTFTIDSLAGDTVNLMLSAADMQDIASYTFTVKYNVEDFEVTDLCGLTARIDMNTGNITGTDIKIEQYEPGTVVFTKSSTVPAYEVWSGVINSIKLKARKDGQMTITYSIN